MAKIKITAHVTASAYSLASAGIDAMDAKLREHGGQVVVATLDPQATAEPARAWSPPPSFDDCEAAGLDGTARSGEHGWEDVARAALAKLAQYEADDDFERVMRAMQPAEERGGPEGAQYVSLMEQIANEARRRARNMREKLDDDAQDDIDITDEQVRELWRAKLISSHERDLAIRTYRGGMGATLRRDSRERCARILASIGSAS